MYMTQIFNEHILNKNCTILNICPVENTVQVDLVHPLTVFHQCIEQKQDIFKPE